jgi:hypothetical protein
MVVFAQTPSPVLNPVYVGTSVNQQILGINTPQALSYAYFVAWDAQKPLYGPAFEFPSQNTDFTIPTPPSWVTKPLFINSSNMIAGTIYPAENSDNTRGFLFDAQTNNASNIVPPGAKDYRLIVKGLTNLGGCSALTMCRTAPSRVSLPLRPASSRLPIRARMRPAYSAPTTMEKLSAVTSRPVSGTVSFT